MRDIDRNTRRKFLYTTAIVAPHQAAAGGDGVAGAATTIVALPPSEVHGSIQLRLPSPSGRRIAIFRHDSDSNGGSKAAAPKKDGGSSKRPVTLEVWTQRGQSLARQIDLSHYGSVIYDGGFGLPSWNADETVLVYTAEQEPIATASFFDAKPTATTKDTSKADGGADGEGPSSAVVVVAVGGQNTVGVGKFEHSGEKYASQAPLHDLMCVNVVTGRVGRVENVPGSNRSTNRSRSNESASCSAATTTTTEGGYALGQPVFSPNGQSIVYTGWDAGGSGTEMPRRLGLIYCQQRPCQLYHSAVDTLLRRLASNDDDNDETTSADSGIDGMDAPFVSLTPDHRLSHSPRFAPVDESGNHSKLVFLTSIKGFETHSGCFALGVLDDLNGKPSILVDQVWDPASSVTSDRVAGLSFPGFFMPQLPVSCFLSSDYILATTQWGSCHKVVRASLWDGSVQLVKWAGSTSEFSSDELLYASPEGVVVSTKTPGQPSAMHFIAPVELLRDDISQQKTPSRLLATFPAIASSKVSAVTSPQLNDFSYDIRIIEAPMVDGVDCRHPIQSILLLPNKSKHEKPPLIVIPHGGPHSASTTAYVPSHAYLCSHGGYALLLVNYRGSTGFGQSSIEALPTKIGSLDVEDLIAATNAVVDSGLVDPNKIGICGGSHGGFLTAHATSQYPDLFRAAVMRNPVVNLATMVTATDIPDWCYVEACGSYNWKEYRPPTAEQLQRFYEKSPVQFIANVRTPTLVALGLKDLRVPPSQGLEWYHSLRSMGIPTKLLTYENDDHAIDGVDSEADHWINIKHWFDTHLR